MWTDIPPHTKALLTVRSWDDNGPHECCVPGAGAFPVQGYSTGPDLPCTAVDGVERVFWNYTVHHCPIYPIVRVNCQHLHRGATGKKKNNKKKTETELFNSSKKNLGVHEDKNIRRGKIRQLIRVKRKTEKQLNVPIPPLEHLQTQPVSTAPVHQSARREMVTSLFWHKMTMGDECLKPRAWLKLLLIFKGLINYLGSRLKMLETA